MIKLNKLGRKSVFVFAFFFVLLTAALLSFSLNCLPFTAYAANPDIKANGTLLSGQGLQMGENFLLTRSIDNNGNTSGSGQALTAARDFYVDSSTSYAYSASGLSFTNGTVGTKLKLIANDASWYGVYKAISDPNLNVTFEFDVTVVNRGDTATNFTVTGNWYANGTSVNNATYDRYTATRTLSAFGTDGYSLTGGFSLPSFTNANLNANACFVITIQSAGNVSITSPKVNMSVTMANISIGENTIYTISGENRSDVILDTASPSYEALQASTYIKSGDKIKFETSAYLSGSFYTFPKYYLTVFGLDLSYVGNENDLYRDHPTGIIWDNHAESNILVSYLTKTSEGYDSETNRYYAEFTVQDGVVNENSLVINPFIYTSYSRYGRSCTIPEAAQQPITIKVDSKAPAIPSIDPASPLAASIANKTWFTESLKTEIVDKTITHEVRATEHVYAFVCPSNVSSLDFSSYNFTPGNNMTILTNEGITVSRQQVIKYEIKSGGLQRTTVDCDFGMSGEYSLVLIAVDESGNVSAPKVYSKYLSGSSSVLIDSSFHNINVNFRLGDAVVADANKVNIAETYIIVGDQYHQNGQLINPTSLVYFENTFARVKTAKRQQWVTIRIAMTAAKAANYELVRYDNSISMVDSPAFVIPTDTTRQRYLDITFQMTDNVIENQGSTYTYYFKERVVISVNQTVFTFNGAPTDLSSYIDSKKASNNAAVNGIDYTYKYYKTLSYKVFPNMNGTNPVIGGRIIFNNSEYTNTTQVLTTIGQTVTINGKQYYTYKTQLNPKEQNQTNYTVYAYNINDYSLTGYIDAGEYCYRVEVDKTDIRYFGNVQGVLKINQASPEVTGLIPAAPLIYGVVAENGDTGLALLDFVSSGPNGRIYDASTVVRFINQNYYMSYSGTLGKYVIISPAEGTAGYANPNVTAGMAITVEFRPINVTVDEYGNPITDAYIAQYWSYYVNYYKKNDENKYELIPGGKHSGNYKTQSYTVTVVISPALASIQISGQKTFIYDGNEKSVTIGTAPTAEGGAALPYTISYAKKIRDGVYEAYKTTLPYNAGTYNVKYKINSALCNYYSPEIIEEIVIEKRTLQFELTDGIPTDSVIKTFNDAGTVYSVYIKYAYGRLGKPNVIAYYMDGATRTEVSVGYDYAYRKIRNIKHGEVVNPFSDPVSTINPADLDVGTYLYKMIVNNENNMGEIIIMVYIEPAVLDNNVMKLQFPALETMYAVYDLDATSPRRAGTDSTIGHMEFGQTLSEAAARILIINESNIANYLFRGQVERVNIGGRFYFSTEQEALTLNNKTSNYQNAAGDTILPVIYETGSNAVTAYKIYVYWEAGSYVDGQFVKNVNFEQAKQETFVYVARAVADFSNVRMQDITYGDTLVRAVYTGSPTASGNLMLSPAAYTLTIKNGTSQVLSRGTHNVLHTFTPNSEFIRNYRNLYDIAIPITVNPKAATIDFILADDGKVKHHFGDYYLAPTVTTSPAAGIPVVFSYTDLNGNPVTIDTRTPVGNYLVTATISDANYGGSVTRAYEVVKGTLVLYSTPNTPTVYYGTPLSGISLTAGRCRNLNNTYVFDGRFEFAPLEEGGIALSTIPSVGTYPYKIKFVPNNADVYNSFEIAYFDYNLTVVKARREISVTGLEQTYTGGAVVPVFSATRPDGSALNIMVNYHTPGNAAPVAAGSYTITFTINDINYEGEVQRVLVINKAPVTIINTGNDKIFNTQAQRVSYSYTATGNPTLTFSESYTDYQGFPVAAPLNVGKYFASINVSDANYQGSALITVNIKPATMLLENLNQTYGSIGAVVARFTPAVNHTVLYKYAGTNEYTDFPAYAGIYNVMIIVEENGYREEITAFENGNDILLTIDKASASIIAETSYTKVYTASPHDLGIRSNVIGVQIVYTYKKEGETEYTAEVPVTAGTYSVKATIQDINYSGTAGATLTITPAIPEIRDNPVITSINYYSLSKDDVTFTGGHAIFLATGQNITAQGKWSIGLTQEGYSALTVGIHTVPLVFTPNDNVNFLPSTGNIYITIYKYDIGSYIRFKQSDLVQEYNQQQLSVSAYFDNDAFMADHGKSINNVNNIIVRVTYNGSQTRPVNVGIYRLGAIIDDYNYAGTATEATFRIDKADPSITLPTLAPVNRGSALTSSAITGGFAYIRKKTSSEQTRTIAGTFKYLYPATVMEKANYHTVWVNFTPNDEVNHNSVNFQMQIYVIGEAVEISNIKVSAIVYGQPLSESAITADSSQPGTVKWSNPSQILNVGERASYTFIPDDIDVYNIKTDDIDIEIAQAEFVVGNVNAKVYVGKRVYESIVVCDIYHSEHLGDPAWKLQDFTLTLLNTAGNLNTSVSPDLAGSYIDIEAQVSHRNYRSSEFYISIRVYKEVISNYFLVGNTSKYYDGNPVTVEDLNITLTNIEYMIDTFAFDKITYEGQSVSAITVAGSYQVTVKVIDDIYDGSKTFTYTVNKRDISGAIKLSGNAASVNRVYSEPETPIMLEFWTEGPNGRIYYDAESSDMEFEYFLQDGVTSYGAASPKNSGNYLVKISVKSSNRKYNGYAVFPYIVNKKTASITLETSYSFIYGSVVNIVPNISVSGGTYRLTYNGNYAVPENVGKYMVIAYIDHANFVGQSAASELTITKAPIRLIERPVISNIMFGQELRNASITGGKAAYGSLGLDIEGKFVFVNPDKNDFSVGQNAVDVKFVPTNSNYADYQFTATITVTQAKGSIEVKSLTAYYTGGLLKPSVVTQPNPNLTIRYEYKQNGVQVEPINAGEYEVIMTIMDENYTGTLTIIFTIMKAQARNIVKPTASNISYGQSLQYSALSGGSVKYFENQTSGTAGVFVFVEPADMLGNVGVYNQVAYEFIPTDTQNYEKYSDTLSVTVVKTRAQITVSNNEFVYGDAVTLPVFTTVPKDLVINNMEFRTSAFYNLIENQNVGSYQFTASVDDNNHFGEITYIVSITKKKLAIRFYDKTNNVVDSYTTDYKKAVSVRAGIDVSSLVQRDISNAAEIEKFISYSYSNWNIIGGDIWKVAPTNVGEYSVTASIVHNNYYLNSTDATVKFTIKRGTVQKLEFDATSLSTQVYGSVSMPIVNVSPSDVKYKIYFINHDTMPTSAGTYTITVVVEDDNYIPKTKESMFRILPKDITIENIKVSDKAYDGLSSIQITGELKGVLINDEVRLAMTARTAGGQIAVGTYDVEILTWEVTGKHASNYNVLEPLFNKKVKIVNKTVIDSETGSYVTSATGFSPNITVSFGEVYDTQNKTNFFTSLIGQRGTVQVISVKENGLNTVLDGKVKFYVKIPDKYLNVKNLTVAPLGELSRQNIIPQREGDYYTFYADRSGEIIFYANDFPYAAVIGAGGGLVLILGILAVFLFTPVRRRLKIKRSIRSAYTNKMNKAQMKQYNKQKEAMQVNRWVQKNRY